MRRHHHHHYYSSLLFLSLLPLYRVVGGGGGFVFAQKTNNTSITTTTTSSSSSTSKTPPPGFSLPDINGFCAENYNCDSKGCSHFAQCLGNLCLCPPGFGGNDCLTPTCDSTNKAPSSRALKQPDQTCTCSSGFKGFNCNACTQNSACLPPPGSPAGQEFVCNTGVKVWKSGSTYCTVNEPALKAIYNGTSQILMARNLTASTLLGSLWYNDKEQFYCQMSSCTQVVNGGNYEWNCAATNCKCVTDSTFCGGPGTVIDITTAIEGVTGGASIVCEGNSLKKCSLVLDSLKVLFKNGLLLDSCYSGECALSTDEPADINVTLATQLSPPEIFGIVAGAALLSTLLLGFILAKIQQARLRNAPPRLVRTGVHVRFNHLSYVAGGRSILNNMSGVVEAGRVLAILGPSGAGKSTFLDLLAGKTKSGKIMGSILVNNKPMSQSKFRTISGYVDQEDLLLDSLTVRETLLFSAQLRLPESIPLLEKHRIVDETIDVLGLRHVAHSRIGGGGIRGISGGEKRRVSIGMELVTSPSILFLDEPTSGLDSYNALMIVKTLAGLAKQGGKTIIFTIHQPRSDVYKLFDDVLLLSKGEIMYLGAGEDAATVMKNRGLPCPQGYNVADHLLDVAINASSLTSDSIDVGEDSVAAAAAVSMVVSPFPSSATSNSGSASSSSQPQLRNRNNDKSSSAFDQLHQQQQLSSSSSFNIINLKEGGIKESIGDDASATLSNGSVFTADDDEGGSGSSSEAARYANQVSLLTQISVLMSRAWKMIWRKPSLLLAHNAIAVVLGVFVGVMYLHTSNTVGGIQNRLGSMFFLLLLMGFSSLSAIGLFNEERLLFLRERSNGYYGPAPFFLTRIVVDIVPLRLLPSLLMGTIAFFLIGYVCSVANYLKFISVVFVFSALCSLFCILIACLINSLGTATLVASIGVLFEMLMAGFLINQPSIPIYFRWIPYLSFVKFSYEALAVNDLSSIRIQDTISGILVDIPATVLLVQFGFDINSYGRNLVICLGLVVFMMILIFLLIFFRLKEKR